MKERHPLAWFPPFMVGVVSLIAAEASSGLLLYSGVGFMRSFTLVLTVLLGSFTLGLWSVPRPSAEQATEVVRRRWLLALLAYSAAVGAAGTWEVVGGFASASVTRGLGLALLAGLPLYAAGGVLSAIAGTSQSGRQVAVAAAIGGTAGTFFVGMVLVSSLIPVSMYGFCLVALSGAALVHGRVLDYDPEEHLVDEEPSLFGQVQVVDRRWGTPRRSQRLLLVGGRLVGGTEEDEALRPWEGAAASLLPRTDGDERPVLVIGGSPVVLIDHLIAEDIQVIVVERNAVVGRMTRRHFGLSEANREGESRKVFEADEVPDGDLFRAVVVDGSALSSGEPIHLPTSSELRRFRDLTARDGFLLLGGDDPTHLLGEEAQAVLRARTGRAGWTEATIYHSLDGEQPGGGLMAFGAVAGFPRRIGEMVRVELPGQQPISIEDLAPGPDPDGLSLEGEVDQER